MSRRNKPQPTQATATAPKKDEYRFMRILWYVMLGMFVLLKAVDLLTMHQLEFDAEAHGRYSILASEGMYIGFNVWAIVLSAVNAITLMLKQRTLFLISLLLLLIIFLYPYFT